VPEGWMPERIRMERRKKVKVSTGGEREKTPPGAG